MSLLDLMEHDARGGPEAAPLLVVRLAGDPVGKGRPRATIITPRFGQPFISMYTPEETRKYEDRLRAAALDARGRAPILSGALAVLVFAYFQIPKSWSERQHDDAIADIIRPLVKPDCDNILKAIDAFNPYLDKRSGIRVPVVWEDDAHVVDARVVKIYAKRQPGLIIEVRNAGPPPQPWIRRNSNAGLDAAAE